ncbi:class I SAM-dependent methyltransferase [Sinisalibacter aestuarii]|uniref:Ubiquinone/menaquinone biosynthesis methyltransferase n=1 Tax=Sinisalibacter aestuarii TaxID=2949426 RepID=A0ABQ5LSP5_9RHOB|nr:class I SAM-dependent methyltransferase [Sinisalibacter aestuarii]GKY88019.1 ubiquinone/menaquinone biosynthesis methyltransferase [Sinisalibacter aestuarii]
MNPFFRLHSGLPREAPGDRASVDWAFTTGNVARDAKILDAGCGPGADIAALLENAPAGEVLAVDLHAPFIDAVKARWLDEPRVTARVQSMDEPEGPFDLVWAAGALYFLGIEAGLRHFRPHLAPGGVVAFSELAWLVDDPAPGLVWEMRKEYPEIGGAEALQARVMAAGYDICGLRVLDDAAWEAYYTPMEARIAALRPGADADLINVLNAAGEEIALWRENRDQLGYILAVARPA